MKKAFLVVLSVMIIMSMAVTVFADDYVSSAELKEVPDVVVDQENAEVGAVITEADKTNTDVHVDHITITSLSQASGKTDDISRELIAAYKDVKGYTDVVDEIGGMADQLKEMGFDECKVSVRSMFDVTVDDQYADKLSAEGSYIEIEFTNEIGAVQGKLLVAHMVDGEWILVDEDLVKVTEETITVQFDDLCPVMFMVVDGEPVLDSDSGSNNLWIIIVVVAVVVLAAAAVVVFVVLKKKKANA